jgi:hypothetical protein
MSDGKGATGSRPGSTASSHLEGVGEKGGDDTSTSDREKRLSNYNYDEAVLKVQEWNEALKCQSCSLFVRRVRLTAFSNSTLKTLQAPFKESPSKFTYTTNAPRGGPSSKLFSPVRAW